MVPIEKLNHAAFFLEPQGFRAFVREQSGLRDGVREAFMVRPHDTSTLKFPHLPHYLPHYLPH